MATNVYDPDIAAARKQGLETPMETMERIRREVSAKAATPAVQQQALAESLRAPAQGGAAVGIPAGTDVTKLLKDQPAVRQLLEEQVATRIGAKPKPAPAVFTAERAEERDQKNIEELTTADSQLAERARKAAEEAARLKTGKKEPAPGTVVAPTEPKTAAQLVNDRLQGLMNEADRKYAEYQERVDKIMGGDLTPDQTAQLQAIKDTVDRAAREQRKTNEAQLATVKTLGIRAGRQRYAPEIETGLIGAEISAGTQRVADIEAKGAAWIAEAKAAMRSENMEALNNAMRQYRESVAEKRETIQTMYQNVLGFEKMATDKAKEAREQAKADAEAYEKEIKTSREGSILGLVTQGVTDPATIFSYVNFDETGNQVGDITISEIAGVMESLNKAKTSPTEFEVRGGPSEGLYELEKDATGQITAVRQLIAPSVKATEIAKPLSATEFETYRKLGYAVTPGMTIEDVKALGAPVGDEITQTGDARVAFEAAQNLAVMLPEARATALQSTVNTRLKQGNMRGVKDALVGGAISALPADQQNKAFGRAEALDSLDALDSLFTEFENNGGTTGLLTGTKEEVMQKIGRTGNPELARIANDITLTIIDYRRSVSGAAFTESEAKAYEDVFPSISKVADLNKVKVASLRDKFNRSQRSVLSTVMGADNYNEISDKNFGIDVYEKKFEANFPGESFETMIKKYGRRNMYDSLDDMPFKKVGGDTEEASDVEALKTSLIQQESGGNYGAIGLETPHGKALGRYQIIPKFHFGKIGLADSPEDRQKFLNSPDLQDRLFGVIIDELSSKYGGDPRKIAAAYYGGAKGAQAFGTKAGDVKQTAGGRAMPSINEYVRSVMSRIS